MKTTKKLAAFILAATMMISGSMTAFAGQWKQQVTGYHQMGYVYENSDGTYTKNAWQWIDGKCYYFNENGIMLADTTTPDGYTVDASGAWTVNGVVQIQETASTTSGNSVAYDPAHPLARKIDEWNLKLPSASLRSVSSDNIQAMLTNQMDQYYIPPVGKSVNKYGNTVYMAEEDYNNQVTREQALYNWYCNWLNGMNFENMSEMERAKEIQKVLAECTYDTTSSIDYGNGFRYDYSILINKTGRCTEFAMAAKSLCTALGLQCDVGGYGDHSFYLVYVDGQTYYGGNQYLNLDKPDTPHWNFEGHK